VLNVECPIWDDNLVIFRGRCLIFIILNLGCCIKFLCGGCLERWGGVQWKSLADLSNVTYCAQESPMQRGMSFRYILSAVNRYVASVHAAFMIHRTIHGPTLIPCNTSHIQDSQRLPRHAQFVSSLLVTSDAFIHFFRTISLSVKQFTPPFIFTMNRYFRTSQFLDNM